MKTLVADAFPEAALTALKEIGLEVSYQPKLSGAELASAVDDCAILIVRSTKVDADAIAAARALSLIVRAGAGVNTIDVSAASARGIFVTNCPGKNSIAVAELTLGLLLAADRRIADNVVDFRAGTWNKSLYSKAEGLAGSVFGIIGFGQIGQEVARRAKAFDMTVCAWSRSLTPKRAAEFGVEYCASVEDLIDRCRIVSLHCALTSDTRGLMSAERIGRMRPGAILLNTARAEVVDESALISALREERIWAGLDVFAGEPSGKETAIQSELRTLTNAVVTHHIGASTEQAQNAVAEEAVRIVREYASKGAVHNWVNRSSATPARWQLSVRHYDKPGVLANVLTELKQQDINAEELENVIFDGNQSACCTIKLDDRPSEQTLERIRARTDEVISVSLFP